MANTTQHGLRVITPEAILSYPHLWQPKAAAEDQEPRYSCCLVFPAGSDLRALKAAVIEAAKVKWGDKATKMIRDGKLRMPFRDDAEERGYPEGSVFVNARSKTAPGIVSIYPDPETGKPTPITDPEQVYPGCYVRASVTAFAYDRSGNRGVAFALNNLQKIRDGERLDSRKRAEDEFEADANAVADLSDLTGESTAGTEAGASYPDDLSDLL